MSADSDIVTLSDGQDQPPPPARFIVVALNINTPLSTRHYDWSRIVAVEIDEPYMNALQAAFGGDQSLNPCFPLTEARMPPIYSTMQALAARAAELKSVAPLTRFWVNFTNHEADWMRDSVCPQPLNQSYIDVISIDHYEAPFDPNVKTYYDWFAAHPAKPDQQLALIPGTFSAPSNQAPYLQGYFDYANNMNQRCNLPLGSRGVTGIFDGCPIWIMMGWLSGNWTDPQSKTEYVGELDPSSAAISTNWRQQLALPLRPGLANQLTRAEILSVVIPLLISN